MNIALIGASGFIGSALLDEALARSHAVTALVSRLRKRDPPSDGQSGVVAVLPGFTR